MTPDEKYVLKLSVERASLIITNQTEPQINVTVTLTSPLMRDGAGDGGESASNNRPPAQIPHITPYPADKSPDLVIFYGRV